MDAAFNFIGKHGAGK